MAGANKKASLRRECYHGDRYCCTARRLPSQAGVEEGELSYKGQGRKLDDAQSVAEIVKEIQDFEELQALRLEGNTVGVEAAQAIAKALETKAHLRNSNLLKSSACHTLQELRLNNCGMGIGGGKILAASLIHCHKNSSAEGCPLSLKVFVAGRNRLENDGAIALAQAFQLMGSLEEIHMPQNGINHPGVTALAKAVQHNPNLRILNLNDNTFTDKGGIAMAQALKHLSSIQVINFGDCLVRPAGAIAIAETVSEGLPILKELNLSFCEITEEAALKVTQAVKHKDTLEKLDLNGNCLGEDGCKAVQDSMEQMNMRQLLGSLSDDEGEPEDDEDEEDDDDDDEDDVDEEEIEEEEEEEDEDDDDDDDGGEEEEEEEEEKFSTPRSAPKPPDVSSFLSFPSPDKLLKLGERRAYLIEQKVDVTDSMKTAEAFIKISSVYKEDNKEVKDAVLESVDALLRKAYSGSDFQGFSFVSSLLILFGLIKSEDKVKPIVVVPGHLQVLEHVVQQDYFPKENVAVLEAFMSRNNKVLEPCGTASTLLQSTLHSLKITNKMDFFIAVVLLSLLPLIKAGKCPRICSCDSSILSVTCAGKNLTEVPQTVDEITVKLDLRNNNLKILPKGSFVQIPYLTHLNLQSCNIEKVMEGAFRSLGRLVSLNLAYNKIVILYQESFDGLSSLKELNLHHNRIEEIQPGAFTQLGVLNMLALTHNQLVYIPNMAFQGLHNIKWLRLSHNSLNNLAPEAFAGLFTLTLFPTQTMTRLPEVTRLDMNHNPMIYIGEEAVSMAKLTHLYLNHMSLQDLSDQALSNAPHVTHLDVSYNQLRYLEPLYGPKQLASLNLTGNPVYCNCFLRPLRRWAQKNVVNLLGSCSGPGHLSDEPLQKIVFLDLRCRQGEILKEENEKEDTLSPTTTKTPQEKHKCPDNCDCNVEGQHATCEGRGHTKVPKGFSATTQLLDLRNNHFHYLPVNSFKAASNVLSLHLEFCEINEVEGGAFSGMKNLLYLYLSENELTSLNPEAFKGAPQLTYLHLEGNRLLQFPGAALAQVPQLFVLHLERNAISKLEPSGLLSSAAPNLKELYLTNNTINTVAKDALDSEVLAILYVDMNQLKEVPTQGLAKARQLKELNLSHNSIKRIGSNAFQTVSKTLKKLTMNEMNTRSDALTILGPGLKELSLRGNPLEVLPDLRPLTGLEAVDLLDIPLFCDCTQLPLYRWLGSVSLEITATCGSPPEHKGQKVKEILLFNPAQN
ncbi:hypothetical protein WMY93_002729 [Mugilogobius chulae]|uniref:Chondroadherin-like protein n=1 Tax=Mugilogobius chulae TaxID=88201 RepID=A0AAW0PW86_9GOBI